MNFCFLQFLGVQNLAELKFYDEGNDIRVLNL